MRLVGDARTGNPHGGNFGSGGKTMSTYFRYRLSDGAIVGRNIMPGADLPAPPEGFGFAFSQDEVDPRLHRVAAGVVVPRAPIPDLSKTVSIQADGEDVATFTGLPAGTRVRFGPGEWSEAMPDFDLIEDGEYEFGTDEPGIYELIFESPLHLPTVVEVHAS